MSSEQAKGVRHIEVFAEASSIEKWRKQVIAGQEEGSVLQGTKKGSCTGFDIVLSMESDEPREIIAELMRLSHRMCFTEAALSSEVTLNTQHILNGNTFEVNY